MIPWPYAHLLINHFPVVLSVCALGAAILALIIKGRGLWQTVMAALTVAGAFIYPVHFTGDEAEQALHDPWYVRHGAIDAHDTAAGIAMIVILIAGIFAAYSWWRTIKQPSEPVPGWMRIGLLLGALASVATVTYTAYLGGKIIHESPVLELRDAPAGMPPGVASPPVREEP